jgi:predicted nucleotidyltransferase
MNDRKPPIYTGPLEQPKAGPGVFEVAEHLFGREFTSATDLFSFVNTRQRDLALNLALLTAGWKPQRKPKSKILLRTADRLFQGFLDRLAESNRTTRFAYFVEEVVLFGSFLERQERVTDIDLCVSYCRKTLAMVTQKIERIMREHRVDAAKAYDLSLQEIGDFLTAGHPRFHLSDAGRTKRLGVPFQVIYRIPDAKNFVRLIAATESRTDVKHLHRFIEERAILPGGAPTR